MENLGSLIVVLHSHLPYGLAHDPMEEHWLYEAAVETYIPLLDMAQRLARCGIQPRFAVSFTPVLIEQLADPRFNRGFKNYLATHARIAEDERRSRGQRGEYGLARLCRLWRDYYSNALKYFTDNLDEDLPAAFRRASESGAFELVTSAATHGYLPLIGLDENVRAQIEVGTSTYKRHFGVSPRGFWLPECGYRSRGLWQPPVSQEKLRPYERRGVDDFLREAEIDYFFIDEAQLKMSPPNYIANSPLRLHRVGHDRDDRRLLAAYARDFGVTRRVWQSESGYPGDFLYLDFHKRTEQGKFRLWRVSGAHVDMAFKEEYDPVRAFDQVKTHAQDFVNVVRGALGWHHHATGEQGAVVASFDAELFGHWWFEGMAWLEQVARLVAAGEQGFKLQTPAQYFDEHRPTWHVELRESSWGRNNDHSVWTNPDGLWVWRNIYEAETRMQHLGYVLNGREISHELAEVLRQAMRELLILEASDWTFMISTWSTRDHAERRANAHYSDFQRLAAMVGRMAAGETPGAEDWNHMRQTAERDAVFRDLDLNLFWRGHYKVTEASTNGSRRRLASARREAGRGQSLPHQH